jgi:hypothetical protein
VFKAATTLEVLRTHEPTKVLNDGTELTRLTAAPDETASEGWFWQASGGGTLLIKLPASTKEQIVIAQ